ncbi:hypothetical protein HKX48_004604 [Thoreauomyces humboldtii]|nr:hypothetical protein HKX48_004604 [Thoreauomyces humboldtii]
MPSIFANVPVRIRAHIPDSSWPRLWPGQGRSSVQQPFEELALLNYLRQLITLFGKGVDFIRGHHGVDMIRKYQSLDAELDVWFLSLPSAVREMLAPSKQPALRTRIAGGEPHFWFAFTVASLGLHARAALRKWVLDMVIADSHRVVTAATFALSSETGEEPESIRLNSGVLLEKIVADAVRVADEHACLLEHALSRDHTLGSSTPHLSMGTYQVGLIYAIALTRAAADGDDAMIRKCDAGLVIHDRALEAWSRIFVPSRAVQIALRDLHAAALWGPAHPTPANPQFLNAVPPHAELPPSYPRYNANPSHLP